jgi:hypothetical protein
MEDFLHRYGDKVLGVLCGFDRIVFRGSLRNISYLEGLRGYLGYQHVLYRDFGSFVETLSGEIKANATRMAERLGRPLIYLESSAVSKEAVAREIMARDGITEGLICILSCVEVCQSFSVRKNGRTKMLDLKPAKRKCLHLYFYYMDREFGFMHVRLQTWVPFAVQVYVNGREWLARKLDREGIGYRRADNCFLQIDDIPSAQRWMDTLTCRNWVSVLNAMSRRVNPLIPAERGLDLRGYYWGFRENEYATDVMFKDASSLAAIYPRLTDHAIRQFRSRAVLRFLGCRGNAGFKGEILSEFRGRVEGVCVKHRVEENSIKMYDKQGSVLRIEMTINNARRFKVLREVTRQGKPVLDWLPMRKGVADIARRVEISRAANARYLDALSVVDDASSAQDLLDAVNRPVIKEGRPYRPLHPADSKEAEVFAVLLRGEFLIQGFRNRDVRQALFAAQESDPERRRQTSGRITRLFRLLRAHGLIRKVARARYYRVTEKGRRVMNAVLRLRRAKVSLLAA